MNLNKAAYNYVGAEVHTSMQVYTSI